MSRTIYRFACGIRHLRLLGWFSSRPFRHFNLSNFRYAVLVRFLRESELIAEVHQFFLRHWKRALSLRQKLRFSEEAFHLLLAGGVGVIGGLVNICFYY